MYQKVKPVSIDEIEKVYVINLERSQDRKVVCMQMLYENFGDKFLNQKIEDVFFIATDGAKDLVIEPQNDKLKTNIIYDSRDSDLKLKQTDKKVYSVKYGTRRFTNKMTKGEIGATLSHFRAYYDIVKNNYKYGIIFEDDFVFNPVPSSDKPYNFYYNLQQALNNAPKDFDILKLDTRSLKLLQENKDNLKPLAKIKHFFKYGYNKYWVNCNCVLHMSGAYAYIISQKGARKIIKFLQEKTLYREWTTDTFFYTILVKKFHFDKTYIIKHSLFGITYVPSVVDDVEERKIAKKAKKKGVSYLLPKEN